MRRLRRRPRLLDPRPGDRPSARRRSTLDPLIPSAWRSEAIGLTWPGRAGLVVLTATVTAPATATTPRARRSLHPDLGGGGALDCGPTSPCRPPARLRPRHRAGRRGRYIYDASYSGNPPWRTRRAPSELRGHGPPPLWDPVPSSTIESGRHPASIIFGDEVVLTANVRTRPSATTAAARRSTSTRSRWRRRRRLRRAYGVDLRDDVRRWPDVAVGIAHLRGRVLGQRGVRESTSDPFTFEVTAIPDTDARGEWGHVDLHDLLPGEGRRPGQADRSRDARRADQGDDPDLLDSGRKRVP